MNQKEQPKKGKLLEVLISTKRSKVTQNSFVSEEFIDLIKYISPVGLYCPKITSPYTDKLKTSKCLKFSILNFLGSNLHFSGL